LPAALLQSGRKTQPLALVLYQKLMPGSQVVNRLQDLKYRVQVVSDPGALGDIASKTRPLLVLADIDSETAKICAAVAALKKDSTTSHLPVIAFSGQQDPALEETARGNFALVAGEAAILDHLPQLLDQALQF
jgi:CheY-like chemotaxis protein